MNKIIIPFTILILVTFATMGIRTQVKAVAKKPCKEFTISSTKSNACRKLVGLCSMVFDKTRDPTLTGRFKYSYQRKILEAADAIEEKDEEVIASKVRKMWSQCEANLTCDAFDIPGGSIIKFAVNSNFDAFLEDLWEWRIDFNRIDSVDGRTPLDYIEKELRPLQLEGENSSLESKLKYYRGLLIENGAKRKAELCND